MEEIDIPKHWQVKKLGDVCQVLDNLRKPINSAERQQRIAGKKQSELFPYFGATGQVGWIDDYMTDGQYILIGEDGAPFLDIYKDKAYKISGKTWVNNHAHILKGKENVISDDFALYYLNSINYKDFVNGTTRLKLTKSSLVDIPVVLPPLPEQLAIVSKIEELLSDLENGKQQLLTAQQQLKVYRQSLLKAAFEGKLTSTTLSDQKEGELPEGWKFVKLSDLGTWKGGGTPSKQVGKYWENGTNLWVTSKDMKIGVINDSIDKITDEAIMNSSANRIKQGAILFVMRSGILRHTFPVAIAGKDLTVNQDLQTLYPNELATSEFIYWFIRAYNNEIRQKCSKDGTTVESIDSNSLKNYPFILPPLEVQSQIVEILESKLTVCDKIEETISQSLLQAETLKQSILKKAFEGKLV